MKLSFSTIGCPNWDIRVIASKAEKYGFKGVEFRGYMGHMDITKLSEFTGRVAETSEILADSGLEIPCLSSSARLYAKTKDERDASLAEVDAYSRLCESLNSPFLRVLGGAFDGVSESETIWLAEEVLSKMADIASEHGVTVLVETHDAWSQTQLLRDLMESTTAGNVGLLWNIHNPYRMADEKPADTWNCIGPWTQYVHVKDSIVNDEAEGPGFAYCLVGDGDVPIIESMACLDKGGYDGWLTLEWEKKRYPSLPDPEVAFPRFISTIKNLSQM